MTDVATILQQSQNFNNSSSSLVDGFATTGPVWPVMLIVVAALIVLLFSTHAYRWALRSASAFASSIEYAIKGVATALVMAVFALPLYGLSQTTPGQRELVLQALAVTAVGYVALVVLGFVGDRVWALLVKRHEAATGHAPFETWGPDEDEEVSG